MDLNDSEQIDTILLNFSKAFDKVLHQTSSLSYKVTSETGLLTS